MTHWNLYILEIMMLSMGPEFDRTVQASLNEIFVKSTPSMSRILSIFFKKRLAAELLFTSSTKIPCKWKICTQMSVFIISSTLSFTYFILQFCYFKPNFWLFWHAKLHLKNQNLKFINKLWRFSYNIWIDCFFQVH